MNEYRIRETGQVVTEAEYRASRPNLSAGRVFTPDDADPILAAPPPATTEHQSTMRNGVAQDALGNWVHAYTVIDMTAEQIASHEANKLGQLQASYTTALEAMYDAKAQERQYDTRYTCALRSAYPSAFQAEGLAFATWMDSCNAAAYGIMAQVLNGQIALPTIDELILQLPTMEWPS